MIRTGEIIKQDYLHLKSSYLSILNNVIGRLINFANGATIMIPLSAEFYCTFWLEVLLPWLFIFVKMMGVPLTPWYSVVALFPLFTGIYIAILLLLKKISKKK